MRVFIGQHARTIDTKNRIQLPSQLRAAIDPERDGVGLFLTPGEDPRTLSIFTERGFEDLSSRIETETMSDPESRQFELQFYAMASFVEVDKQGRIVVPDRLRKLARLGEEIYLVGRKFRIDVWNRPEFDRALGIDWEGDGWPDWHGFLRMKPSRDSGAGG